MHDVLRQRLMRRLESLPEAQIYQVLDYVEFLESKYSGAAGSEASGLQRFAEGLEDRLRKKSLNPATIREAFQVIAAADRVLSGVSNAGKQLLDELVPDEPAESRPGRRARREEGTRADVTGGRRVSGSGLARKEERSAREAGGTPPPRRDPGGAGEPPSDA